MNILFAILVTLIAGGRAVSLGAALFADQDQAKRSRAASRGAQPLPHPVSFHDVPGRGLMVRTWINSAGPFNFAIDTGAGATLLSARVAAEAGADQNGRLTSIAGLSGSSAAAHETRVRTIAIGDSENYVPARGTVIVVTTLPRDLDGVLDPTEAFTPLGYQIDLPRLEISAFDPRTSPVLTTAKPEDGTVARWISQGNGRRPFVPLGDESILIDTGSSLGFAIRERESERTQKVSGHVVRDVGGGVLTTRRVSPATISIGGLSLRNVPTDVVSGSNAGAPMLLGLSALRPFRLRFDPVHRLIEIAPHQ